MKKFLIIRFSSIGDIVLTTPVIRCLKEQGGGEVHFITKSAFKGILGQNPYIDKLITIDNEITEVLEELKKEEYDHIIDLHHNLRSLRLKKALGRPATAFPKLNFEKFLLTSLKINKMPDVHVVDRYFETVKKLGITNDGTGLDYFIPEKDVVDLNNYNLPNKYVVFAIGAQFATKRLPNEKIIEIIKQIDFPVVLLGGPTDFENAIEIKSQCEVIDLVGQVNINQSASIVQQAKKVITHDTGMMHIAVAFKKPIISIWGNTVPSLGMYPYYPNHPELYSIHEVNVKCRPCSKIGYQKCPKKHFKCMLEQDVNAIVDAIN
ncbi:MAG: glycosyltransferase family 9 protein [Crocinitomicaceae bacterium]|nr:glycosyltransferase family 9 protein [Crocinitomicaceae bacterium]